MGGRRAANGRQIRARLAVEAARVIVESGVRDFQLAKRKAAGRLGLGEAGPWPRNEEIEAAVLEHQRLFGAQEHGRHLRYLREVALRALRMFEDFEPRLVGPVLRGSADRFSAVELHLFAEPSERVATFLHSKDIPYELDDRRHRLASGGHVNYPLYRFLAGDAQVELVVFALDGVREAPLCPVDGRPMERAGIARVSELTLVGHESG